MRGTELLQEVRKMRFEEACGGWQERGLTQEEAARIGGMRAHSLPLRSLCPRKRVAGGGGSAFRGPLRG